MTAPSRSPSTTEKSNSTATGVTGLEIKQAAIAQGVPIQLDFQLAEIRPNGEHQIIGDGDVVTVTRHSKFVATAADDNS